LPLVALFAPHYPSLSGYFPLSQGKFPAIPEKSRNYL
jgi:hypothetical protein